MDRPHPTIQEAHLADRLPHQISAASDSPDARHRPRHCRQAAQGSRPEAHARPRIPTNLVRPHHAVGGVPQGLGARQVVRVLVPVRVGGHGAARPLQLRRRQPAQGPHHGARPRPGDGSPPAAREGARQACRRPRPQPATAAADGRRHRIHWLRLRALL